MSEIPTDVHPAQKPTSDRMAAWVMIALLVLGLPIGGWFAFNAPLRDVRQINDLSASSFLHGRAAQAVESAYEQDIFFRSSAIGLFNAIAYGVFGEGRQGVVVGSDGWLFTVEEFEWSNETPTEIERNTAFIVDAVADLTARNLPVTIALVPAKADMYQHKLGAARWASEQAALYDQVRDELIAAGLTVPDLRPALAPPQDSNSSSDQTFLRTDTHWTVHGAERVAAALAEGADLGVGDSLFETSALPAVEHTGDLRSFLDFGAFSNLFKLESETLRPFRTIVADADLADLFGDDGSGSVADLAGTDGPKEEQDQTDASAQGAIALVGTSYSANTLFSFEPALRIAFGRDVINHAAEGQGPFAPMTTYLNLLATVEAPVPTQVLWEIPVRYMK